MFNNRADHFFSSPKLKAQVRFSDRLLPVCPPDNYK